MWKSPVVRIPRIMALKVTSPACSLEKLDADIESTRGDVLPSQKDMFSPPPSPIKSQNITTIPESDVPSEIPTDSDIGKDGNF